MMESLQEIRESVNTKVAEFREWLAGIVNGSTKVVNEHTSFAIAATNSRLDRIHDQNVKTQELINTQPIPGTGISQSEVEIIVERVVKEQAKLIKKPILITLWAAVASLACLLIILKFIG